MVWRLQAFQPWLLSELGKAGFGKGGFHGSRCTAPCDMIAGRSSGQQLSRVVPSSGPMPSPVASAVLIPGTMEPA